MATKRGILSGATAGAVSAFLFVVIHDFFISDIWSTLLVMLVAGAICGICIGWTYTLLFKVASVASWMRYNLNYLVLFVGLGVTSVLVFEPITTIAAVIAANEPPNELFAKALPMTGGFVLLAAIYLSWLYAQNWIHCVAICATCIVLVLLLGLNVSVIGLVQVPRGSAYLIAELFGLLFVLSAAYAVTFAAMERNTFVSGHTESNVA